MSLSQNLMLSVYENKSDGGPGSPSQNTGCGKKWKKQLAVDAFLFVGLLLLTACNEAVSAPDTPLTTVDVAPVILKKISYWDEFNGRISAIDSVDVRPRVSGYIDKVVYKEGEDVRRGDLLFVIDSRSYEAAFESAKARLERAKATALVAKGRNERAKSLLPTRAISQEEADNRNATHAQAKADVLDAEAALDIAKLNLAFTEVRAPIDGRVGRAHLTVGNLAVADQTPLTSMVSQNPVYVDFDPDEQSYLKYTQQMHQSKGKASALQVKVGLANEEGFPHSGIVDFTDNKLDAATGSIRLRAQLNNDAKLFTPGLYARVQLGRDAQTDALLIDDKAVITDQDRRFVYVLGPNDIATRKDIKIGRFIQGLRVVESGLVSGDKVIVSGLQKIFATGTPVKPTEVAMNPVQN